MHDCVCVWCAFILELHSCMCTFIHGPITCTNVCMYNTLTSSLLTHLIPPPLTLSLLPPLIPPPLTSQVNGEVVLEGMISLYWGLKRPIVVALGDICAKQKMKDATYLQILDQATKKRDLSDKELKWLKDISDSIAECQGEWATPQGEESNCASKLMDKPVKYDNTLKKAQFEQYSDPKVRRTLGCIRPRSNTQVRKRSASFRTVSKQKEMEELMLSEVSWAWGQVYD